MAGENSKPKKVSKAKSASEIPKEKKSHRVKEEDDEPELLVSKVTRKSVKEEVSVKKTSKSKGGEDKDKRSKRVYILPGQKHDPPEERDPLRIFYESLHQQIPCSEMAEVWMMEHGLLSPEKASKAYERKQKRLQQPVNSKSKNKRSVLSDEDDGELTVSKKKRRKS